MCFLAVPSLNKTPQNHKNKPNKKQPKNKTPKPKIPTLFFVLISIPLWHSSSEELMMLCKAIPVRVPVGQMQKWRHLRESCLPWSPWQEAIPHCPVGTKLTGGTSSSCGFSKLSSGYLLVLPSQTYLSLSNYPGPAASVQFLTLQHVWGSWFIISLINRSWITSHRGLHRDI